MATETRQSEAVSKKEGDIGTGPYLAKVVSQLDPSFMSSLEVTLLREQGNSVGDESQTYIVKYMTPFYGSTGYEFMGTNTGNDDAYNDTQKSYGMWFCPPDIGVTVMVMFVDGNPADGYWIGCIPSRFANNMVPAIGASDVVDISSGDKSKYATSMPLPVAEVNRKVNDLSNSMAMDKLKRPVHPIADRFLEQGLLEDDARGSTTSTVRRDIPNMVFGILTPGPLDKRSNAKKSFVGRKESPSQTPVAVSRLGGTQFVMDDGDDRYQRKKPASKGGVEYADILAGESGDANIPYNEYFRVRTRTGHQILMHNSEDLIYISNSRGTTWVELTSNGKIDIYAEDSISIHASADLNIRADRDINMEAGRNVNIKASADYSSDSATDSNGNDSGRVYIESKFDTRIIIGQNGNITTTKSLSVYTKVDNNFTAVGATNLKSGKTNKFTSTGETHIKSSHHYETAGKIDMNGPAAVSATEAKPAVPLELSENIVTDGKLDWPSTKYIASTPLMSIMKRVPMHEPWPLHENFAPTFVTPDETDREV
jgi:hypothetical protein